jgi:hypothetical protein
MPGSEISDIDDFDDKQTNTFYLEFFRGIFQAGIF